MTWTVDKIAQSFIAAAEWEARNWLGDAARCPMPIEEPYTIQREDYNRLVCFVRERLG